MIMNKKLVFATSNEGKMREVRMILGGSGLEIFSMKDLGISAHIVEDGATYEENARIKAEAVMKLTGQITLADDSGIEIAYLGGAPGVYSARYLGEDTSYEIKNRLVLEKLEGAAGRQRAARYVCAIAAAFPDGETIYARGIWDGEIAMRPAGSGGFGYDPIFWLPDMGCTAAQLPAGQKNEISHRGKALRAMREKLSGRIGEI